MSQNKQAWVVQETNDQVFITTADGQFMVARIAGTKSTRERIMEDARLIGAAPDLNQALYDLTCCFGPSGDPEVMAWWEARVPEYEGDPGSAEIRAATLAAAKAALVKAVRP